MCLQIIFFKINLMPDDMKVCLHLCWPKAEFPLAGCCVLLPWEFPELDNRKEKPRAGAESVPIQQWEPEGWNHLPTVGRIYQSSAPSVPDEWCVLHRGTGMEVPADTGGSFTFLFSLLPLSTPTALIMATFAVWGTRWLVNFTNLLFKKKNYCKERIKKTQHCFPQLKGPLH